MLLARRRFERGRFCRFGGALGLRREQAYERPLDGRLARCRRDLRAKKISDIEHVDNALAEGCDMRRRDIEVELGKRAGEFEQQAGAIDEAVLHNCAHEHVLDTVFDLLRWPEGDFAFVVDETNPDDVGVSVPVEDAVTQARQRLDSWSTVSTTIPS